MKLSNKHHQKKIKFQIAYKLWVYPGMNPLLELKFLAGSPNENWKSK